jgi:hypothetical protein
VRVKQTLLQDGTLKMGIIENHETLAGKSFGVHLLDGGSFYFKCTGYGDNFISGFDSEGTDIKIEISDIELLTGVEK